MIENKLGEKLFQEFGGAENEKVITGIKNTQLNISYLNMTKRIPLWGITLIGALTLIVTLLSTGLMFTFNQRILAFCGLIILTILTIVLILNQCCKIYIKDNNLIWKNKLNIKKIIDLNKKPRIYMRQKMVNVYRHDKSRGYTQYEQREDYYIYVEQKDIKLQFRTDVLNIEKSRLLIDAFVMKDRNECTKGEWNESVSYVEKNMFELKTLLNEYGKIIGVKDKNKKIIIRKNGKRVSFYLLILSLIALLCLEVPLIKLEEYFSSILLLVGIIINIGAILVKSATNKIKILCKEDMIKIDKYKLNYRENNIRLDIEIIQTPFFNEKYYYKLIIIGEKDKYVVQLGNVKVEKIRDFIDNLILEEK